MLILFQPESSDEGQKDLFPCFRQLLKAGYFIAQLHRHGPGHSDFGPIKFHFAQVDHVVLAVDQKVDLQAFFLLVSFFVKGRGR